MHTPCTTGSIVEGGGLTFAHFLPFRHISKVRSLSACRVQGRPRLRGPDSVTLPLCSTHEVLDYGLNFRITVPSVGLSLAIAGFGTGAWAIRGKRGSGSCKIQCESGESRRGEKKPYKN